MQTAWAAPWPYTCSVATTHPPGARRGLARLPLRRVTDFIESHLDRDLTLNELARVVNLSGSHFKTLFKASLSVPVHAYVVQRRFERAKSLLSRASSPLHRSRSSQALRTRVTWRAA
jgi:AraC-like DNA-binding protein